MKKEVINHIRHLEVTFDKLLQLLFSEEELNGILADAQSAPILLSSRTSWIKTKDLAVEDVTTEKMAFIHMLWLQSIGRISIEDIDPFSGAIRLHICLPRKDHSQRPS